MEFKEQIQRILENVPKVYEAGSSSIKNEVANALKGSASGSVVAMTDISPLEHELEVKVSRKNLIPYPDVSTVEVKRYGKNMLDFSKAVNGAFTDNGDGTYTIRKNGNSRFSAIFPFYIPSPQNNEPYTAVNISADIVDTNIETPMVFMRTFKVPDTTSQNLASASFDFSEKGSVFGFFETYYADVYLSHDANDGGYITFKHPQITLSYDRLPYEPYIEPTTYPVEADGTVKGIKSLYPITTIMTDTKGAVVEVEYNRDLNKAFAELYQAIISLGGNV